MKNRIFVLGKHKASIHRTWQNQLLRDFTKELHPKSVLNLGARPEDGDKEGRKYSDYFPGADFWTLDTRPHDHPKYLQGDLMDSSMSHGPFDLVLAMSVIEHIDRPWLAAPVISCLVKPGGHLYVAMPWFYPTHKGPDFGDHWRALPSGIGLLFDDMEVIKKEFFPSSVKVIRDRRQYWNEENAAAAGSSILLRKKE